MIIGATCRSQELRIQGLLLAWELISLSHSILPEEAPETLLDYRFIPGLPLLEESVSLSCCWALRILTGFPESDSFLMVEVSDRQPEMSVVQEPMLSFLYMTPNRMMTTCPKTPRPQGWRKCTPRVGARQIMYYNKLISTGPTKIISVKTPRTVRSAQASRKGHFWEREYWSTFSPALLQHLLYQGIGEVSGLCRGSRPYVFSSSVAAADFL